MFDNNIIDKLMKLYGYEELFPPQEKALEAGVAEGGNLVLATPTASGKTFIATIAIVSRLLKEKGKAYYVVPLKSIASEKLEYFSRLKELGLKTRLVIGDIQKGPRNAEITIITYEKMDSMLRGAQDILDKTRIVVLDEIHYVGDLKRGPVLESLIAHILSRDKIQILALSATVPNVREIAEWLNATPVISGWRPVPLLEGVYKNRRIYYPDGYEEEIKISKNVPYIELLSHKLKEEGQALVFSQSRRRTVQLAKKTIKLLGQLSRNPRLAKEYASMIMDSEGPLILRETLSKLVSKGVAFHHAGLGPRQRKLIEKAFREGAITVIHATPTLAAGVNLPARYVIIEEYYRFEDGLRQPIPVFEYKQLAGRAGRPGLDKKGEAIIIASVQDKPEEIIEYYINGEIESVESKLSSTRGLRHFLLGALTVLGRADRIKLESLLRRTLYARQENKVFIYKGISRALSYLSSWGLIEELEDENFSVTPLGRELARLYMDPSTVQVVRWIKERATTFNERTGLYLIASMPDMVTLPPGGRKEQERLLDYVIENYPELVDFLDWFGPREARIIKTVIALDMWINEYSDDMIYEKLGAGPGDLHVMTETGSWIAGSLARISMYLGFSNSEESVLRSLESRIRHGVKPELLPLVAIPGIGRVRARKLYEAGYRSLADLAVADPKSLLRIRGIGPVVVRSILEFFGRRDEARAIASVKGRGLESFF